MSKTKYLLAPFLVPLVWVEIRYGERYKTFKELWDKL